MSGITNTDRPTCNHTRLIQGGATSSGYICADCGAQVATNYDPYNPDFRYVISMGPTVPDPVITDKGNWTPPPGARQGKKRKYGP